MDTSICGFEVFPERLSGVEDGPGDIDASAREGDEGLIVRFPFRAFPVVEGFALCVCVCERDARGLEDGALDGLVSAGRPSDCGGRARLSKDRGQPGGCGRRISGPEAFDIVDVGDEVCRHAVLALHSDQLQSLISVRVRRRDRAVLPPEPSRAASMAASGGPLPSTRIAPNRRSAKAGAEAHVKGRAA